MKTLRRRKKKKLTPSTWQNGQYYHLSFRVASKDLTTEQGMHPKVSNLIRLIETPQVRADRPALDPPERSVTIPGSLSLSAHAPSYLT